MTCAAIQWLPASAGIGRALAERLDVPGHEIALHRFPDGELRVTVGPAAPTIVVCCSLDEPNEKLIALLFTAEALRRGGARRLVLVAPYFSYMRQDAAFHSGEAISQRAIGDLFVNMFDRVITMEAHLHRAATLKDDRSVQIVFSDPKLLLHRPVLLIDDIVSSGSTLIACAEALASSGVSSIDAVVIHALFPPELMNAFGRTGIRSLRSTNSVPHPTNAIALDHILADALLREVVGSSIAENRV